MLLRVCAVWTIGALGAACSSSTPPPGTVELGIGAGETAPANVAYQDGSDATWHAVALTAGVASFVATGDYQVVSVCDNSGSDGSVYALLLYAQTIADPASLDVGCAPVISTADETTVTATMVEPGTLAISDLSQSSGSSDWAYSVLIPSGTYDVAAISSNAYTFQRGVTIGSGSVDLGTIDASSPLTTVELAATGLADVQQCEYELQLDDQLSVETDCMIGSEQIIPYASLGDADFQYIEVFSQTGGGTMLDPTFENGIVATMSPTQGASFPAPSGFASVTVDDQDVDITATGVDGIESGYLFRTSPTSSFVGSFSGGYIEDHAQLSVDMTAVPGFIAEWQGAPEELFYEVETVITSDGTVVGVANYSLMADTNSAISPRERARLRRQAHKLARARATR